MYKIPKDIDFKNLNQQTLSHITFAPNYVLLNFDNFSIQFSGHFEISNDSQQISKNEVYPVDTDFGLLSLLGSKIDSIDCDTERSSLTIKFPGNYVLYLGSNDLYESFEMNINGKRVIV